MTTFFNGITRRLSGKTATTTTGPSMADLLQAILALKPTGPSNAEVLGAIQALAPSGPTNADLLNAIRALAPVPVPPAPAPTPPPASVSLGPTNYIRVGADQKYAQPAEAISVLTAGGTLELMAGVFAPFAIPSGLGGVTIVGAGPGKTFIDGKGGVGAGSRLPWGKGGIHTMSSGTIRGITFQNCGGADRTSDGEAGIYAELFSGPGLLKVLNCRFIGNENGIFIPPAPNGAGISIEIDTCDFGDGTMSGSNGQARDGRSHDAYIACDGSVSFSGCRHHGNWWGNNIKVRSKGLTIGGGYNASLTGSRWIDMPDAGSLRVTGGTYVLADSASGGNVLGDGEESTANGPALWSFSGVTIYIGRWNAEFNSVVGTKMNFDATCRVIWGSAATAISVESAEVVGLPLKPSLGGQRGEQPVDPGFLP